jgi:hypothetical protein
MDTGNSNFPQVYQRQQIQRYAPHSCWPWVPCHFHSQPPASRLVVNSVRNSLNDRSSAARERLVSSYTSESVSHNRGPRIIPGVVTHNEELSVSRLGKSLSSLALQLPTSPGGPIYPQLSFSQPPGTIQPILPSHRNVDTVKMRLSNSLEHLTNGPQAVDRAELKRVLEEIFDSPMILNESCSNIEGCFEFAEISSIIVASVGDLEDFGLSLLTILEAGELTVFVSE